MSREIQGRYNKNEGQELDNIIHASYDDFVRLERRNLIIIASITLLSRFSGIDPTTGSIFGFTFNHLSEKTYYSILIAVILYFMFAFAIYGLSGFKKALKSRSEIVSASMKITFRANFLSFEDLNFFHGVRFYSWLFLHYILPLLIGLTALLAALLKFV